MADTGSSGIDIPDADPVRTYSPEEQEKLTRQLEELTARIHAGAFSGWPIDRRLIQHLHAQIFEGVRGHAGRLRSRSFGQEVLTFGPHFSLHRKDVETALVRLFSNTSRDLAALGDIEDPINQVDASLRFAAKLHADFVQIHPFEDGNGRTGRALMSVVLVRLGLRPVPLEAPRHEYYAVLNRYFAQNDPEPLYDLVLRLYPV